MPANASTKRAQRRGSASSTGGGSTSSSPRKKAAASSKAAKGPAVNEGDAGIGGGKETATLKQHHPLTRDPAKRMNPTSLATGFYGPRGEKIRHVVHQGTLRLPPEALRIFSEAATTTTTTTTTATTAKEGFESLPAPDNGNNTKKGSKKRGNKPPPSSSSSSTTDQRYKLPDLDSVPRPSRNPAFESIVVTELQCVKVRQGKDDAGTAGKKATYQTVERNIVIPVPRKPKDPTTIRQQQQQQQPPPERIRGGGGSLGATVRDDDEGNRGGEGKGGRHEQRPAEPQPNTESQSVDQRNEPPKSSALDPSSLPSTTVPESEEKEATTATTTTATTATTTTTTTNAANASTDDDKSREPKASALDPSSPLSTTAPESEEKETITTTATATINVAQNAAAAPAAAVDDKKSHESKTPNLDPSSLPGTAATESEEKETATRAPTDTAADEKGASPDEDPVPPNAAAAATTTPDPPAQTKDPSIGPTASTAPDPVQTKDPSIGLATSTDPSVTTEKVVESNLPAKEDDPDATASITTGTETIRDASPPDPATAGDLVSDATNHAIASSAVDGKAVDSTAEISDATTVQAAAAAPSAAAPPPPAQSQGLSPAPAPTSSALTAAPEVAATASEKPAAQSQESSPAPAPAPTLSALTAAPEVAATASENPATAPEKPLQESGNLTLDHAPASSAAAPRDASTPSFDASATTKSDVQNSSEVMTEESAAPAMMKATEMSSSVDADAHNTPTHVAASGELNPTAPTKEESESKTKEISSATASPGKDLAERDTVLSGNVQTTASTSKASTGQAVTSESGVAETTNSAVISSTPATLETAKGSNEKERTTAKSSPEKEEPAKAAMSPKKEGPGQGPKEEPAGEEEKTTIKKAEEPQTSATAAPAETKSSTSPSVPSESPAAEPAKSSVSQAKSSPDPASAAPTPPTVIGLKKRPPPQWEQHIPGPNDENIVDPANKTPKPKWYRPDGISELEMSLLPEWFDGSAPHRTPESYHAAREHIMLMCDKLSNRYITGTMIRRAVPGDIGSLLRLHAFLTQYSLINEDAQNDSAPTPVVLQQPPPDSKKDNSKKEKVKGRKLSHMRDKLIEAVVFQSQKRQKIAHHSPDDGALVIDWEFVAQTVGHGMTARDCEREFLTMPLDQAPVKSSTTERSITPDATSMMEVEQQLTLKENEDSDDENVHESIKAKIREEIYQEIVGMSHPKAVSAAVQAALSSLPVERNMELAQKSAIASLVSAQAIEEARSAEDVIAHVLSEIVDLRMQKLENRLSLLDDVEGMLEAERVALELERRDLYTARCRHWFGGP